MKTKILAFLMAVMLVAGIVAVPTPVSAATDFKITIEKIDADQVRLIVQNSTSGLPKGTLSWSLDEGNTYNATDWTYRGTLTNIPGGVINDATPGAIDGTDGFYVDIVHDYLNGNKIVVKFTPEGGSAVVKSFLIPGVNELIPMPYISADKVTKVEMLLTEHKDNILTVEAANRDALLSDWTFFADYVNYLNNEMGNLGTLALFLDITASPTVASKADFRIHVPGIKAGTVVKVLHYAAGGDGFFMHEAVAGNGYIDIKGVSSFSPFMIYTSNVPADVPETGDNTNMMLYTVIGMIALGGIGYMAFKKRTTN